MEVHICAARVKMDAYKTHAYEMHTREVYIHEMHAHEMHAHKTQAYGMQAYEMHFFRYRSLRDMPGERDRCQNCQISMVTIENAPRHSIDCILPGRRTARARVYIDISRYDRMSHISTRMSHMSI
jgi:hypothetical protein